MSATFTIARKELRALFQSPIAIIFLSVFLVGTLFLFFQQARFFARNLADVRPLFEWLPLLLIFLVSAITMRSWAEERKAGTLEVLLTLPVRTIDLVLGKFVAGMGLVALALLFTLPIPITVAILGPLDWGPVIGGYFAALLLASAYMAIGLCVSARTDNQVVALMVTLVLGGILWLVGTSTVTSFFGQDTSDLLRAVGTGSRFESVQRGVLDLRDIAFYASLTAFFLVLNGVFLERERLDPGSEHGRGRSIGLLVTVVLVGANALAANLWLTPVNRARVDLTENNDYSISPVTRGVLGSLDAPLRIRGLFSERTHPLLAPLVPQIRDMLREYEIAGDGNVQLTFADPNADQDLEAELNERYSIQSIPFGVADAHSQAVVNAYFTVLVTYGDRFEQLGFQELIEVRADPAGMQVKLRNLEYDLTRAIKKVSQDFTNVESLIGNLGSPGKITLYATPAGVPEDFQDILAAMRKAGGELGKINPAMLSFEEIDPIGNDELQKKLFDEVGVQPLAADLFGTERFYLHLVVQIGDQVDRIMPRGDLTEVDVNKALEASLRRATPGQLKKVLLVTEEPIALPNPQLPPNMQMPPPDPDYRGLEQILGKNYTVTRTTAAEGWLPEDADVAIVGKMGKMNPRQQYALDQFLMRGGTVVALAGAYRLKLERQGPMKMVPEDRSLFDLLEKWGVRVDPTLVADSLNAPFPQPVKRRLPNGMELQQIALVPYPFFPDLRSTGLNEEQPVMSGITTMTMPWASPVEATSETLEGREIAWLARSTAAATTRSGGNIEPDMVTPDGIPVWTPGADPKQRTLALAVSGRFPSYFADLPNPTLQNGNAEGDDSGRTLKTSIADGRVVVLGSSELVSDVMLQLAQNTQSEQHGGNPQLLQNLVDWALEDTDLLQIRTGGAYARTLVPMDPAQSRATEIRTWLMVLVPILLVVFVPRIRRRNTTAIPEVALPEDSEPLRRTEQS